MQTEVLIKRNSFIHKDTCILYCSYIEFHATHNKVYKKKKKKKNKKNYINTIVLYINKTYIYEAVTLTFSMDELQ